jgi:hypothetical protein
LPVLGAVAQLVRASPCHGEGRGFEPHQRRHRSERIASQSNHSQCGALGISRAKVAQSVEHAPEKRGVASSILALGTIFN